MRLAHFGADQGFRLSSTSADQVWKQRSTQVHCRSDRYDPADQDRQEGVVFGWV